MDEETRRELLRLEGCIKDSTSSTNTLSREVNNLANRVTTMEAHRLSDQERDAKNDKQSEALSKLLLELKGQFDTFNGIIKGIRLIGVVFGALIIATILGVSSILWNFNSDITEVKTKIERIYG